MLADVYTWNSSKLSFLNKASKKNEDQDAALEEN
jgi:hypothetical protein